MCNITVGIPTKNRYEALLLCLNSIVYQTLKPREVIIVDDSDDPIDIRKNKNYEYTLNMLDTFGVRWKVVYGQKKGQHFSHQYVQDTAENEWIFRIDDDEIAEPDCLERLASCIDDELGAVGPLVLMPFCQDLVPEASNDIDKLDKPNIQWFDWSGIKEVDHINSTFLYRRGIANYNLTLSKVAHREETLFTYQIKQAGFKVLVNGDAKVWHYRQPSGGIRTQNDPSLYDNDDRIFTEVLKKGHDGKLIVLNSGIGDHFAFKHILKDIKKKYKKLTVAVCYPDVFYDEPDLKLISIADAIKSEGNLDSWDIYRKMIDWNHKGSVVDAYRRLYL